jgi:hypothetical protein
MIEDSSGVGAVIAIVAARQPTRDEMKAVVGSSRPTTALTALTHARPRF